MRFRWPVVIGVMLVATAAFAQGQPVAGVGNNNRARFDGINAATDVRVEQRLDARLPLERPFRDETGQVAPLSKFFGKRPVLMVMPFYKCTGTCVAILNGVADLVRDPGLRFKVGKDFDVVTISINPKETADLAAAKKRGYMSEVGIPGVEQGWHFLTGEEADIKAVADAAGYFYKYNIANDQYAHGSAIWLATPQGKISRYFFGVVYPAKDVRLGLTEAGRGQIGSVADQWLLFCYHYDPQKGKYGLAIFRLMQVLGSATILLLGTFIVTSLRKERAMERKSK
jgi:protein SCO1/2